MKMQTKKTKLLITASLVGSLAYASIAHAQQTSDSEQADEDVIVVTGIKQSLEESLEIKRNATQFVDAIVAEDIAKLADENIAESLQRVTGVVVRRSGAGEGDQVDVRGLSNNRVAVNGRTLPAFAGRNSGRSDRDNGLVNILGTIPAEIISRLEVTKLPAVDQVEGSLGGNVNIVTRRPFDSNERIIAGSLQGSYNDLSNRFGFKGSLLFSDTFADDTFGVLLNISYTDRRLREDRVFSFSGNGPLGGGFAMDLDDDGNPENDPNGDGVPVYRIADLRYQQLNSHRQTFTVNGAWQWQASDDIEVTWDGIYTQVNIDEGRNWFAANIDSNPDNYRTSNCQITGVSRNDDLCFLISEDETLIAGSFRRVVRGNYNVNPVNKLSAFTTALAMDWQASDRLDIFAEASFSTSSLFQRQNYLLVRTMNPYQVTFDYRAGAIPSLQIEPIAPLTDASLFDSSLYNLVAVFDNAVDNDSDDFAFRLDADYELSDGFEVEFGGRYQRLIANGRTLRSQNAGGFFGALSNHPAAEYGQRIDRPDLFAGIGVDFPRDYFAANPRLSDASNFCQTAAPGRRTNADGTQGAPFCPVTAIDPLRTYRVAENTYAGYAKVNFNSDMGTIRVSGNAGLRIVHTQLDVTGSSEVAGVIEPAAFKRGYTNYLPSGVVKLEFSDSLLVRFGVARVMARPDPVDLRTGFATNVEDAENPTATGGNPELNPYRATAVDLSLEWYADNGAYVTLGGFYKNVQSFVSVESVRRRLPGVADTREFLIEQPVNGEGAKILGMEAAVHVPFDFLPGMLDGLGILANYTFADSDTSDTDFRTGETLPLPGLSRHSFNVIGYYEKGPIGIRVAYNWRDEFLERIVQQTGVFFNAQGSLNASIRYAVTDNVSIDFEAVNLTRSAQRQYAGTQDALASYAITDRRFFGGVRFRF